MTIQRVLCAPLNYSHRQAGQLAAFRELFGDANVLEFDFMGLSRKGHGGGPQTATSQLELAAASFQPDWIWLQVQGSNVLHAGGIERIRKAAPRCLITHWMGDARTSVPRDLAAMCHATHATLISSVGQAAMYLHAGALRVEYVQIGLDEAEDVHGIPVWDPPFAVPPVVFCGGYYGATFAAGSAARLRAIRALVDAGLPVGVVGTGWPKGIPVVGNCHVKQQHHVYRRASVALSINHFNDLELYYSDRQLIAMASGTPVVCRYVPGLEREFEDATHCLWWHNEAQLVECVRLLLGDADLRKRIGDAGRDLVVREHTWTARIQKLLPKANAWHQELVA